jgi:transposase InsO family protein
MILLQTQSLHQSINSQLHEITQSPVTVEHINIIKITTDAGSEFISNSFREACANANIEISIVVPNLQEQNQPGTHFKLSIMT